MILKGIKLEGRVRIYIMSFVMLGFGTAAFELPKLWMKFIGVGVLSGTYIYATTYVAKKFAYKRNTQHKCKEVKT